MEGKDVREFRKARNLTQQELADHLGLTRVMVGMMERGATPISPRTIRAIRSLGRPALERTATTHDPMERLIEEALISAGIPFETEMQMPAERRRLDFFLPLHGVAIEVKRLFSPRAAAQLESCENLILVQGERAVRTLAAFIQAGGLDSMGSEAMPERNLRKDDAMTDFYEATTLAKDTRKAIRRADDLIKQATLTQSHPSAVVDMAASCRRLKAVLEEELARMQLAVDFGGR